MEESLYRTSASARAPLRIGLLLNDVFLPRWTAEVLEGILASNVATIELVVFNGQEPGRNAPPRSFFRKVVNTLKDSRRRRTVLHVAYQRWDARNADPATDPAAMVDFSEQLRGFEQMRVDPVTTRFVHRFPEADVQRIRDKQLDVLVRFGFNILRGDILKVAKYGVWSYHHGDNEFYRGGPACFWEVFEESPTTGALLQVLTEELDAGKVLCKGVFATHDGLSNARNRVVPYWGASTFLLQKLRELHERGWEYVESRASAPTSYKGKRKVYSKPTNLELIAWFVPLATRKLARRLVRGATVRHWRLAFRKTAKPLPASSEPDLSDFRWIESPKGRLYADPFLAEEGGKRWVFFEDYDYATRLGKISCAELRDDGLGEPMTALQQPYHASYPCLFRDNDQWYMIPETVANGTVDLYRCTRFPDKWQHERELFKARAVDTTIWIEHGIYWLFVPFWEWRGGACQLWLYSARSLEGPWIPHPASPINTDVRYARNAGAIFRFEGRLYRPSQDGTGQYGRALILNEILQLDAQNYAEVPRLVVDPALVKGLVGVHTYARLGDLEMIDGKANRPVGSVA